MTSVCVFMGSRSGVSAAYMAAVEELGRELGRRGLGAVYGGGRTGLMGAFADAALEAGAEVVGVIPQGMVEREIAHTGVTELAPELFDGGHVGGGHAGPAAHEHAYGGHRPHSPAGGRRGAPG